ncbi:MAG: right-handed parallel beta-helix repeat-containing protein, partial [Candidatus Omnitrophica bacterium]|nr:right-handed parallel beta-helix repeat-containing protein [Candidatus Omnitrophota bacterium]
FLIGWLAVCSESATWTVGGGGGSDFETLSAALGAASASDTLLVAPGVYDTTTGEIFPLPLSDGVAIIAASSDNRPRVVGDREHPVIRCERLEGFLLDGLVIEGGGGLDGAGISCATSVGTIRNCRIEKNFYYPESEDLILTLGRGVFLDSSATTLRNCWISENRGPGLPMSIFEGGGMVCFGVSSATLEGCTITENHNDGIRFFASGDLTLINSLIAKTDPSTPQSSGSGLAFFSEGICRIQSSSIVGHLTGGISVGFGGTCQIKNSIVWNLGTELNGEGYIVDHSCIRGGHEGEGNLETYPQFVAPANGDWRLSNGSPCIDSGESSSLPAMDLDGADRVRGNEIDMGAYESPEDFEPLPSGEPPTKLYVARTATGKSGDSWEDPLSTLYEALLRIAEEGEIWIRSGKYPGGFLLPGNIDLIGGFAGHEQTPEERDFSTGSTILEATGSGTTVLTAFRDDSFIMNGLTLAGGSSPGSGGGLYGQSCAGRISDCTFISNSAYDRGAGAYLTGSGDFLIERCSFLGNTSAKTPHDSEGGGLYSSPTSGSSLTLRECVFRNNGTITEGAAILAAGSNSHLSIEDCLFEENFYVDPGFPRPEFSVLHRRGGASTRVINTVFRNNRHVGQFNFSYLYTWTISTSGSGGTTSFEHCDIVDNIGLGGLRLGSGVLSDCLIERNEGAGVSGGELLIEDCR